MLNVEFTKVVLNKESELNALYTTDAIVIEGLVEEDIGEFVNWVFNEIGCGKLPNVYPVDVLVNVIKGKTMNEVYKLTGNNAYNDELTIVAIGLNQINSHDISKLALKRFDIGARWFSDVVRNNLEREKQNISDEK